MASLRELQRSFAAALRDPSVACAVLPPANLAIYRNNASGGFPRALTLSFPGAATSRRRGLFPASSRISIASAFPRAAATCTGRAANSRASSTITR